MAESDIRLHTANHSIDIIWDLLKLVLSPVQSYLNIIIDGVRNVSPLYYRKHFWGANFNHVIRFNFLYDCIALSLSRYSKRTCYY